MAEPLETIVDNAGWPASRPSLSVLIPFYRDDPRPLLGSLEAQAKDLDGRVEIIALDDGGGLAELAEGVADRVRAMQTPARFIQLSANTGRAKGRNRLGRHARADHFLFVDSDMRPDADDFLERWLELVEAGVPVACGGFNVECSPVLEETNLHRAMAIRSECLPAAERSRAPAKYVFTNNLLVRRDVFEADRFDEGFVGWGWEDVEWGVRISRRWPILHVDNPAQNCGLSSVETLLRKYQQAAPNFARMVEVHPDVVSRFPSYRAAQAMKLAPFRQPLLKALTSVVRNGAAPMRVRELALKSYRAGLYADAL